MRVAIVHDACVDDATAAPDVAGVLETVAAVAAALDGLGHECVRIAASQRREWIRGLEASGVDVVFNLCEGLDGDASLEAEAARAMMAIGVPVTGAAAASLDRARRKDEVNALLHDRVPVPYWALVTGRFDAVGWPHYPAIVKPAGEDAGIGISSSAVVQDAHMLERALHEARAHAPLIVQQFLEGVELVVGFVAEQALPVAAIDFSAMPGDLPRIVGYAAKWDAGSPEDAGTRVVCPAAIDAGLAARAVDTARTAWEVVVGAGYGRVDLRADAAGVLHVLDVNPNADLAPSAGLARMAAAAGWSYATLIGRILDDALSPVNA